MYLLLFSIDDMMYYRRFATAENNLRIVYHFRIRKAIELKRIYKCNI